MRQVYHLYKAEFTVRGCHVRQDTPRSISRLIDFGIWLGHGCTVECIFPSYSLRKLDTLTRKNIDKMIKTKNHTFLDLFFFPKLSLWEVQYFDSDLIWKQMLEYCNFPWDKKKKKSFSQLSLFLLWNHVFTEKQCFIKLLCELWSSNQLDTFSCVLMSKHSSQHLLQLKQH